VTCSRRFTQPPRGLYGKRSGVVPYSKQSNSSLHAFKDPPDSAPLRTFVFNLVPPFLSNFWPAPNLFRELRSAVFEVRARNAMSMIPAASRHYSFVPVSAVTYRQFSPRASTRRPRERDPI